MGTLKDLTSEAVEADSYLRIYEAIEDASCKIQIPIRHPCAVRKVVWSSFDYMSGPELGFTWEAVTASDGPTPSGKSSGSDGSRDSSSFTSSIAKAGGSVDDYEEIDDVYKSELLIEAVSDLHDCVMCMDTHSEVDLICGPCNLKLARDMQKLNILSHCSEPLYLDEFMTDSHSTCDGTATLLDEDSRQVEHLSTSTSMSKNQNLDIGGRKNDVEGSGPQVPSNLVDLEMNSLITHPEEILAYKSSEAALDSSLSPNEALIESVDGMTISAVDSGIAGTVSAHSDLCTAAVVHSDEMLNLHLEEKVYERCTKKDENIMFHYGADVDYDALCDLIVDNGRNNLSDEEYITKFVLAEQICSTPMPSNPVIHKLTLLPKRRIFVGSYLFQIKSDGRTDRSMYAISLIGEYSKWDWYVERQNIIEEVFTDIIPRLRTSYLTACFGLIQGGSLNLQETMEDFICRTTREISKFMLIIGLAEAYPLFSKNIHDIRLQQTYFGDIKLKDNLFLARAITANYLSQARCVIVGDNREDVVKMMLTLYLFVAPEWRWLCIQPYKHVYCPYFRLQAITRAELNNVMHCGVDSHWPISIVDLDRQIVCNSAPYSKHRILKLLKQKNDVLQILKEAGIDSSASAMSKIDLRNCHTDTRVVDFLVRMDWLPIEKSIRFGFVNQFRLMIENSARAFIAFVQDISEPDCSYKQHATSSKWNLWFVRKSLNLTSNTSFLLTLSEAERILPEISDFIYESNALS
ncbi:unnamed protein product [Thelazia callipaeda]|uniref:ULP_PROTEASE domain-containing protein n=1 Tax=Thelazia callipaeda TaxID=103827 RepID=A0A0N5CPW4_THECL|nr:unnamed protein product [Thelazia callipaeda]